MYVDLTLYGKWKYFDGNNSDTKYLRPFSLEVLLQEGIAPLW